MPHTLRDQDLQSVVSWVEETDLDRREMVIGLVMSSNVHVSILGPVILFHLDIIKDEASLLSEWLQQILMIVQSHVDKQVAEVCSSNR